MDLYQIIQRPLVTEKSMAAQGAHNRYVFAVELKASKELIRQAVEKIFKVSVIQVNTTIIRGKIKQFRGSVGKRPNWKKAWITLKQGDKIEIFEGV